MDSVIKGPAPSTCSVLQLQATCPGQDPSLVEMKDRVAWSVVRKRDAISRCWGLLLPAQRQVSPHPGEARGPLRWVGVVRGARQVPCGHGAQQPRPAPSACLWHPQSVQLLPPRCPSHRLLFSC